MASSDILSQTLHSITETKLDEVFRKHANFERGKEDLLHRVNAESVQREKVRILLDGNKKLRFMDKLNVNPLLSSTNIRRFLEQAKCDPSVSLKLQKEWEVKLRKSIDVLSLRFEYASLYGRLVTEWISNSDKKNDSEMSSVEDVGRKEMHEQRATWEAYVFTPLETDTEAITSYLQGLFTSTKERAKALQDIRKSVTYFEKSLSDTLSPYTTFDELSLKWCIDGLLASDLLTDAKRAVLNEISGNKVVVQELADVLNMRMSQLDSWSWGERGTPVEQRRQLNGLYRFYHDEDLLQSLFLRLIGVQWSVRLKWIFKNFAKAEGTWISSSKPLDKTDRERRKDFLRYVPGGLERPVESQREQLWREDVFLEQLQSKQQETARAYDSDGGEPKRRKHTAERAKTPQEVVQSVLHLLVTEIIINRRLGGDTTVIRSAFKWFGPSLAHSTVFTVLRFFGVSEYWISFFKRALEAPMQFVNDGNDAPVQICKRGTPISGPLSDALGESVLFCLDFAVNQGTNGVPLFRLHDDIWFWGSEQSCELGWNAVTEFSKLMGLELNTEKTGCVRIGYKKPSSSLPVGDVRWGLLKLDAATGRFLIDQKQVDEHIEELRRQLAACKNVFDWIQAWGVYGSSFFTTNFGKPAKCNGKAHVDMMIETFGRIQHALFANVPGGESVTAMVKNMISERFGVEDIPDGFLYFPIGMGGLDLKNPFIGLYQLREEIGDPELIMDSFFEEEEAKYRSAKKQFEDGIVAPTHFSEIKSTDEFMSMEEYTRYREQTSAELGRAFSELMEEPSVKQAELTKDVAGFIDEHEWSGMKPAEQWVIQLCASGMIDKFGGLNVVEKGLLPTGLVTMFRSSRFQWEG
ncbi:unnamed protein product [Calypogeia fissa]